MGGTLRWQKGRCWSRIIYSWWVGDDLRVGHQTLEFNQLGISPMKLIHQCPIHHYQFLQDITSSGCLIFDPWDLQTGKFKIDTDGCQERTKLKNPAIRPCMTCMHEVHNTISANRKALGIIHSTDPPNRWKALTKVTERCTRRWWNGWWNGQRRNCGEKILTLKAPGYGYEGDAKRAGQFKGKWQRTRTLENWLCTSIPGADLLLSHALNSSLCFVRVWDGPEGLCTDHSSCSQPGVMLWSSRTYSFKRRWMCWYAKSSTSNPKMPWSI